MSGFGLLGEKLSHSFSPQIHARLADYEYKLYEKTPDEVGGFLQNGSFDGLNVTIPYKKIVISFCASLSDSARKIGSVNTLIRERGGALRGDNTDYYGFLYMLGKTGGVVHGKKALVLGSGGAALTVRAALGDMGAGEIITVSRGGEVNYGNIEKHLDAQIIVNTTPVGMYPGNGVSPVELSIFGSCEAVLDVVYNPAKTELLLQAEDLGIPCAGGLHMLVAQAKRAAELFTGSNIAEERIDVIADELLRETMNVALIGMPGCGKSSVGRRLAALTGREFYDTDELASRKAGKSIERIFAEDGEEAFRNAEQDALKELSAKCGCIIATGGGIVKRDANRRLLRQNSVNVFIDRDVKELPTAGRPLSQAHGAKALYAERFPLYNEWSAISVKAGKSVDVTAQAVREALSI